MNKLSKNYLSETNSILKKILKSEGHKFTECAKIIEKSYKNNFKIKTFRLNA